MVSSGLPVCSLTPMLTRACNLAFLEQVKTRYELHVYTMGTRPYALEILKSALS